MSHAYNPHTGICYITTHQHPYVHRCSHMHTHAHIHRLYNYLYLIQISRRDFQQFGASWGSCHGASWSSWGFSTRTGPDRRPSRPDRRPGRPDRRSGRSNTSTQTGFAWVFLGFACDGWFRGCEAVTGGLPPVTVAGALFFLKLLCFFEAKSPWWQDLLLFSLGLLAMGGSGGARR